MKAIVIRNSTLSSRNVRSAAVDLRHERVVLCPDDPDREEAHAIGEVRGPRVEKLWREGAAIAGSGGLVIWLPTFRMSSVAAIANTPSANVSSRLVLISNGP